MSENTTPVSGQIVQKSRSRWYVRTSSGRIVAATSFDAWKIGDNVVVVSGQIIGRAGRAQAPNVYEV